MELTGGAILNLGLQWLAIDQPEDDYILRVTMAGPAGEGAWPPVSWSCMNTDRMEVAATWETTPSAEFWPTSHWQAGAYQRGPKALPLPSELQPGRYCLYLQVLDPEGQPLSLQGTRPSQALGGIAGWQAGIGGDRLGLGVIQVVEQPERARSFDVPLIANSLDIQLGDRAELLGYDLSATPATPGGQIEVTLYWRAGGPTDRSYKVFTHLGIDGTAPLTQHDGYPGDGCCPTNTWLDGEIVVDRHIIVLPTDLTPGNYLLSAGMYDEATGERLQVFAQDQPLGVDSVPIAEIQVGGPVPSVPAPVRSDAIYHIFLPLLEVGR
jgi:hypothetical protein